MLNTITEGSSTYIGSSVSDVYIGDNMQVNGDLNVIGTLGSINVNEINSNTGSIKIRSDKINIQGDEEFNIFTETCDLNIYALNNNSIILGDEQKSISVISNSNFSSNKIEINNNVNRNSDSIKLNSKLGGIFLNSQTNWIYGNTQIQKPVTENERLLNINSTPFDNDGNFDNNNHRNAIVEIQTFSANSSYIPPPPEPEPEQITIVETFDNFKENIIREKDELEVYPINFAPVGHDTYYYGNLKLFSKRYLPWYGSSSLAKKYANTYKKLGYLTVENILKFNNTIDPLTGQVINISKKDILENESSIWFVYNSESMYRFTYHFDAKVGSEFEHDEFIQTNSNKVNISDLIVYVDPTRKNDAFMYNNNLNNIIELFTNFNEEDVNLDELSDTSSEYSIEDGIDILFSQENLTKNQSTEITLNFPDNITSLYNDKIINFKLDDVYELTYCCDTDLDIALLSILNYEHGNMKEYPDFVKLRCRISCEYGILKEFYTQNYKTWNCYLIPNKDIDDISIIESISCKYISYAENKTDKEIISFVNNINDNYINQINKHVISNSISQFI